MNKQEGSFIVVGATSGIGFEIVKGLLRAQKSVVMIARSSALVQKRLDELKNEFPKSDIKYLLADLSIQEEVERLAKEILALCPRIACLINNAGVFMTSHQKSADGIELTFAVNHMSHFILTQRLMNRLIESGPTRIVMMGSNAHRFVKGIQFSDIGHKQKFRSLKVYGQSKLSNILFMRSMAQKLPATVTINAADPGAVATRIGCNNGLLARFVSALCRPFYSPIPKGAETALYLALSPEVTGQSGNLYKDKKIIEISAAGQSAALAEELWQFSANLWHGKDHEKNL